MDLETELRALEIEWPRTPPLELELRLERRRSRGWLLAAAVAATAAVAAALAVPQSRGAILRFFHLGAATVRIVDTLPRADERPLASGLGPVIPVATARRSISGLLVPPVEPLPPLHETGPDVVSLVFQHDGRPVFLSEFESAGRGYLKKLAADGTSVEGASVAGAPALFVSGRRHAVFFAGQSPRLAGNVLIWEVARTTYRLEGANLTKDDAIRLAQSLRKG